MKKNEGSFFNQIDTLLGWFGMAAILLAYALLSFGALKSDSLTYQLLNLLGALGVLIISLIKKAFQPAALNIAWAVIALVAILGMFIK
ncbi:MAG: hypothetical protein PHC70_01300 [Patescibacteria group bacterium]|nr:hypothetical protein [Patescibacteria group bacterium]